MTNGIDPILSIMWNDYYHSLISFDYFNSVMESPNIRINTINKLGHCNILIDKFEKYNIYDNKLFNPYYPYLDTYGNYSKCLKLLYHTSKVNSVFIQMISEQHSEGLERLINTSSPRLNDHIIGYKEHLNYQSNK
jgi:hypothetical protein